MEPITLSLQITLIGMGLVFASLILLWGVMELMVRLTAEKEPTTAGEVAEPVAAAVEDDRARKQQAAAAAVAVALAGQDSGPHEFPLPPTAMVSAWQAVMRTDMLKKRGQVR
jgi:sodium pump decarboxylase gamma subunit